MLVSGKSLAEIFSDNDTVQGMNTFKRVTTMSFSAREDEEKAESGAVSPKEQTRKRNSFPVSYIAVIAHAILSSPQKRLPLSDIYRFIEENYPGFTENRARWKNTVRHNLSLHDCFLRGEVALNKKGCNWRIHPSFEAEFSRGDFSRRRFSQGSFWAHDRDHSPRQPNHFAAVPWTGCQICAMAQNTTASSFEVFCQGHSPALGRSLPYIWNPNIY